MYLNACNDKELENQGWVDCCNIIVCYNLLIFAIKNNRQTKNKKVFFNKNMSFYDGPYLN